MGANKLIVAGSGLAALLAVSPCQKSEQPQAEQKPVPIVPRSNEDDVTITLSGSRDEGLVSKMYVELGPRMRVFLSDYVPVSFAVPSISYQTDLPVEHGLRGFHVTFPRPYRIDGKPVVIYGHHPATRERKVLFEDVFHFEKQRWY